MKKVILPLFLLLILSGLLLFSSSCKKDNKTTLPLTVTDVDGNLYHTVTIGTQTWMVENLKTTHYRNGDPIAHVADYAEWNTLTTGAYCNYANISATADTFGRLYNWYAVADGPFLAPAGWHIPSDAEWVILADYLGGSSIAGSKLKEAGNIHFIDLNDGATNESGFTALPGGLFCSTGFIYKGIRCYFWTSSEITANHARMRTMDNTASDLYSGTGTKNGGGYSVRCVKD